MLEHGGRLRAAAVKWGIPLADWIDLSTGIAPWSYPVQITADAWQRLPEDDDGLEPVAARYYGHPAPLALPGSQAAIQLLPQLLTCPQTPGSAVLPAPTYGEYAPAWRSAGYAVSEYPLPVIAAEPLNADVIMLASPNNPTGEQLDLDQLRRLARQQEHRGGWLVIDAAFADYAATTSLDAEAGTSLPRLVMLHSLGKFFGLAGARVGFCCAAPELRQRLVNALGPWAVAHPSRQAAQQALGDHSWQAAQRARCATACHRLLILLASHALPATSGGQLFCYTPTTQAAALHEFLAQRGILVRRFDQPSALRFGLPGTEPDWQRLDAALNEWSPS